MAMGAGGVIAWLLAVQPSSSNVPEWPVYVLAVVAIVGLYGMLAPLLRWWPWHSSALSASAEPARVLRRRAEPPHASASKPQQRQRVPVYTEAALPFPALADELSRCKERGVRIRREIDPPTGYAASSMSVLYQTMPAMAEQNVRSWSAGVRAHLERDAPRFLVIFDEGPDLPPSHFLAAFVATTKRPELLAFLDDKLAALERIICTIVGSEA